MATLSRRQILKASALASVGAAAVSLPRVAFSQSRTAQPRIEVVRAQGNKLDLNTLNGHAIIKLNKRSIKNSESYTVYVINKSDWRITHVKINGAQYQLVPPIDRTCQRGDTCKQCYDAQHFQPAVSSLCTDAAYSLILILEKGTQGAETNPITIAPDCNHVGMVVCFNEDGN